MSSDNNDAAVPLVANALPDNPASVDTTPVGAAVVAGDGVDSGSAGRPRRPSKHPFKSRNFRDKSKRDGDRSGGHQPNHQSSHKPNHAVAKVDPALAAESTALFNAVVSGEFDAALDAPVISLFIRILYLVRASNMQSFHRALFQTCKWVSNL